MKKSFLNYGLIGVLSASVVYAVTIGGGEPPQSYVDGLKTCTKGEFTNTTKWGNVIKYKIRGLMPNGRCEVVISSYTDYINNKETYETAQSMLGGFMDMAGSMGATQEELKQVKTEVSKISPEELTDLTREETICKFSQNERNELYKAYLKHDNKNPEPKISKNEFSFSFNTDKMSSYDTLMMNYSFGAGPCVSKTNDDEPDNAQRYACEYRDATCYVTLNDGVSSVKCSPKDLEFGDKERWDTVVNHAKSGKCTRLF